MIEEHIRRIEEVNPRLNVVVVHLLDRALSEADAARARGRPAGPVHGVSVTIKSSSW